MFNIDDRRISPACLRLNDSLSSTECVDAAFTSKSCPFLIDRTFFMMIVFYINLELLV